MLMAVREPRDEAAAELFALTRQIADAELRPHVAAAERDGSFPRGRFRTLGQAGLLSLPYPEPGIRLNRSMPTVRSSTIASSSVRVSAVSCSPS